MNFNQFLEEGLATAHGKVEMAIRELNLKYTVENTDKAKIFHIEDFILTSSNNGEVTLNKKGMRGPIATFKEFNFNKIRERAVELLKKHVVEAKEDKKEKEAEVA